jgi:zinc protease
VLRDASVPIVAVRATWVGGLRYEDERSNGISHMLAALLSRGTKTRSAEQIMNEVEGMAGSISGYSGRNSLGLQAEFLSRYLERGFDLVADCLLNATFSEEELDKERRIVVDDIRAQEDNLGQVSFRLFHSGMWKKHPYRLDPLGTSDSVAGFTRRKLLQHFHRFYAINNLTLAVVGDVDPNRVISKVATLFAYASEAGATQPDVASEPASEGPRQVFKFLAKEQAHVVLGFPGVTFSNPDRFSLEILAHVLSGQGGRLFSEIREKRALAYRVSAFSLEGMDPGYFAVYVATSPEKVEEAVHSAGTEGRGGERHLRGRIAASAALSHRDPRHRSAAQECDCGRAGVLRGLRSGVAILSSLRRQHHEGHGCRCCSSGAQVPRSQARSGGRGRAARADARRGARGGAFGRQRDWLPRPLGPICSQFADVA